MRQYGRREFLKVAGLVLATSSVGILSGCGDFGSGSGAGNGSSSGNGGNSGNTPAELLLVQTRSRAAILRKHRAIRPRCNPSSQKSMVLKFALTAFFPARPPR